LTHSGWEQVDGLGRRDSCRPGAEPTALVIVGRTAHDEDMSDREPDEDVLAETIDPEAAVDQLAPVNDDPELPDADVLDQSIEIDLDDDYDH
jgi:hypothetical protein